MRHRVDTFKIGRSSAHRRSMLANMVSSLFCNGQITTTLVKGRAASRFADRMITLGKKGDLHRRRLAVSRMRDKDAVKILFEEVAPRYADRNGGYTRIIKLGKRIGDASEMCILQLVEASEPKEEPKAPKAKKTKSVKAEKPEKPEKAEKAEKAEKPAETKPEEAKA